MATHSSTLAWKIPWTEEPGRLQSMGSQRVRQLSDFTFTFQFHALEKEMATHSSVLAWRISGMAEPGGNSRKLLKQLSSSSSRLVITFLPRSKHLLISWLQSPYAVIVEPHTIKSVTVSTVPPTICHEVMGPDAIILVF